MRRVESSTRNVPAKTTKNAVSYGSSSKPSLMESFKGLKKPAADSPDKSVKQRLLGALTQKIMGRVKHTDDEDMESENLSSNNSSLHSSQCDTCTLRTGDSSSEGSVASSLRSSQKGS